MRKPIKPRIEPELFRAKPALRPGSNSIARALAGRRGEDWESELRANVRHERQAKRREFLDALRVRNAAEHLERLPERGVSLHCIMRGNYNGWDIVPAVLRIIEPETIAELHVCTLGFNRRNASQLVELIDAGQIGRADFICSVYYHAHERAVCNELSNNLDQRGGRFLAMRCHAKLLLMRTTDGNHYVNESSANLRSCRNIEQFTFTNDRGLWQFHREWINEVMTNGQEEKSNQEEATAKG